MALSRTTAFNSAEARYLPMNLDLTMPGSSTFRPGQSFKVIGERSQLDGSNKVVLDFGGKIELVDLDFDFGLIDVHGLKDEDFTAANYSGSDVLDLGFESDKDLYCEEDLSNEPDSIRKFFDQGIKVEKDDETSFIYSFEDILKADLSAAELVLFIDIVNNASRAEIDARIDKRPGASSFGKSPLMDAIEALQKRKEAREKITATRKEIAELFGIDNWR